MCLVRNEFNFALLTRNETSENDKYASTKSLEKFSHLEIVWKFVEIIECRSFLKTGDKTICDRRIKYDAWPEFMKWETQQAFDILRYWGDKRNPNIFRSNNFVVVFVVDTRLLVALPFYHLRPYSTLKIYKKLLIILFDLEVWVQMTYHSRYRSGHSLYIGRQFPVFQSVCFRILSRRRVLILNFLNSHASGYNCNNFSTFIYLFIYVIDLYFNKLKSEQSILPWTKNIR